MAVCLAFPILLLMLEPSLDPIILAWGWLSILLISHVDGSQSLWPLVVLAPLQSFLYVCCQGVGGAQPAPVCHTAAILLS